MEVLYGKFMWGIIEKYIVVVKLMKIKFSIFLNFFHVIFKFLCLPNPEGGGIYFFGADPVGVRFFVSVHYLPDQLMDFNQTCIDTLLGGRVD